MTRVVNEAPMLTLDRRHRYLAYALRRAMSLLPGEWGAQYGRQRLLAAIAAAVLLGACAHQPPAARPREGAPVARTVQVAGNDKPVAVVPPTLAPVAAPAAIPTPTAPLPAPSPTMAPTHIIASTGGMPVNM